MHFQKDEAWYVLFVNTNQEEKVRKILEKEMGDKYKFIIPTRELRERKNGKWHNVKRKLFPGYVLIKAMMNAEIYYKIKRAPGIIKLLRDEEEVLTVEEKELKVLKILIDNNENNIGISKLYKENDEIRIIAGPLLGLEGQIIKIDSRKGRAKVNLSFMNEERIVELGIELVDKI
ncbi:transcription termination/antitermination protein NusG [Clostridium gelidum]|uniref:Transcription termination/antitermination protein NusG n=1 Tax=Clostridium gelidum TaxID=704125 RepID=A0ABM7T566_9CLOT|nr:antiterminator LoaP [Clostridium gelidum]BCZ47109.1 transcription termination/antitermination protein NusG [Clostridium gelidum]